METVTTIKGRVPILLVEDEDDQAELIQEALQDTDDHHNVLRVECGEEAIAYLSGEGKYADRNEFPYPLLVLLDLRMPGMGGFGVLRWLKANSRTRNNPDVIVLSSVQCSREIEVVYELGAQYYWTKTDIKSLQHQVRLMKRSWQRAECPTNDAELD